MLSFLDSCIRWSFYLLFIFVPLIFTGNTSELFEFNKLWITFGLTICIVACWIGKWIVQKQITIQRTTLDIPILLFLFSQLIATIFSMDVHTSLWGYYSRFNGGLLSLLSYAALYFAFVSNIERKDILKYLWVTLGTGVAVALWGLPSHFGYDPTCYIFRGTLDVSCWTFAFQPKVRIFSTLGQPDWLAAYLVYLLPLTTALTIVYAKQKHNLLAALFVLLTALFYIDLLYTRARSGFIGMLVSLGLFFVYYFWSERQRILKHSLKKTLAKYWYVLVLICSIGSITFFVGSPISQLDVFTPSGIAHLFAHKTATPTAPKPAATSSAIPVQEFGGTDSGKIRLFVWKGAWDIFLSHPLIGTGVETFGYAYYQYRPAGHNLTSEWDYLYNKAHNEYLNYLATTGLFGFLTYMGMIGFALWAMSKGLWAKQEEVSHQQLPNKHETTLQLITHNSGLITAAFIAAYISILVTNFFGFSVVIMNIWLFVTPAFVFLLTNSLKPSHVLLFPKDARASKTTSEFQWIGLSALALISTYLVVVLIRFWMADTSYAMGSNLDHANEYQSAYSYLHDAVSTRPSEPTFQDELSVNDAVLAAALLQNDASSAGKLAQEAVAVSNSVVTQHPNIVSFWKTRVRVFYTLSALNPQYLPIALQAIQKAQQLAPTDAKVSYNLGLLYGQTGSPDKAVETLQKTIALKPDYRDAYYALAIFYRQLAVDKSNHVIHPDKEVLAVNTMHFILTNFGPSEDLKISQTLKSWGEQ